MHLLSFRFLAGLWLALSLLGGASAAQAQLPDFTTLVEQNKSAVVSISVEAKARPAAQFRGDVPEIFRRFFGDEFNFEMPPPDRRGPQGLGSGFIISADGYILSNNHVVADAERVLVRLSDRRELEAKVVGTDPKSDIALLKVEASGLPVVKIGKSETLKVGEWVFAVGAPFGFDYSVTQGIVSALGRGLPNENYVPFIQTDVAINPGNSGGPLFNLEGEVVGINSQIFSGTGGYMGLSFAIPVDVAMEVSAQLKETGKVTRGWLGVVIQDVDRDLAESFGMARPEGALVSRVLEDSPAAKGGLEEGDVITSFNGKPVVFSSDLPHLVGRVAPGTRAKVTLVRAGKTRSLTVTVGELPADDALAAKDVPAGGKAVPETATRLGLVVEAIPEARRRQLGVRGGVIVARVAGDSAARAGLRPGDVILAVNNRDVDTPQAFAEVVAGLPAGKWVPLLVSRGGSPQYIALQVE
jgi:serine protease Do